jgi:hypothetical protein
LAISRVDKSRPGNHRVAKLEQALGIYDLAKFTPR